MKKITALILCLLLCFAAASCSDGQKETTAEDNNAAAVAPRIKLVLDSAAVVAGETVEISVNISDAPLSACFDISVYSPRLLSYESSSASHSEFIIASNVVESEDTECVDVQGMVARTCDLLDDNVCVIRYKVSEDVKTGDKLVLTVRVPSYSLGTDESGNDTYSVAADVITENLTLIAE